MYPIEHTRIVVECVTDVGSAFHLYFIVISSESVCNDGSGKDTGFMCFRDHKPMEFRKRN